MSKGEQNLSYKITRLGSLIKVSRLISSTLSIDELLNFIMHEAANLLDSEAASLLLVEETGKYLEFSVPTGNKSAKLKGYKIKLGEGIAGWIAMNRKSVIVNNVQTDKRFLARIDKFTDFKTHSIIGAPLLYKDDLIGVIEVINKKNGSFDEEDEEILWYLAGQAAIAIRNAKLIRDLDELFFNTTKALATTIDAKDPYTHGHSLRVMDYSLILATALKLDSAACKEVKLAGLLHDIGKIGVDDVVLRNPGRLTEEEYNMIKKHPQIGAKILQPVKQLENIIPGVVEHHERWDGRGYPKGLVGNEISLYGSIVAIADTFDAITSDRAYRRAHSKEYALEEIKNNRGTQFAPYLVDVFVNSI